MVDGQVPRSRRAGRQRPEELDHRRARPPAVRIDGTPRRARVRRRAVLRVSPAYAAAQHRIDPRNALFDQLKQTLHGRGRLARAGGAFEKGFAVERQSDDSGLVGLQSQRHEWFGKFVGATERESEP